jgi:hypothetical protein
LCFHFCKQNDFNQAFADLDWSKLTNLNDYFFSDFLEASLFFNKLPVKPFMLLLHKLDSV